MSNVEFQTALLLRGLTSGLRFVDELVGGLQTKWFVVLQGAKVSHELAERYCVRVQLPGEMGGWGSSAVYVDAGNSFDPYHVTAIAREYGVDVRATLDRVIVSRAFTVYQLLHLVQHDLPRMLQRAGARLAVIANIFELFDDDVKPATARKLVQALRMAIHRTYRNNDVTVLLPSWKQRTELEAWLFPHATVRVEFTVVRGAIHAVLCKHPVKGEATRIQPRPRPATQAALTA